MTAMRGILVQGTSYDLSLQTKKKKNNVKNLGNISKRGTENIVVWTL